MPKSLLQPFLAVCALLASVSVMAQTVTDVPLSDADVRIKTAAQSTAPKATQSAASEAAKKLPTAEEIAAERARLERMRAALAAERAALEQYKADLVKRQQEAAAAEAKAKADAEAKAKIEKAIAEKTVGSAGSVPPPAKDDPVAVKNLSPEEIQLQKQRAIERAKAIEKAIATQKAADAKKKAAAAASTPQTTSPKDKDVATMKLRRITQNKVRYVHLRDVAVNYGLTFAYTKKNNKISGAVIYDKTRKAILSLTYREGTVNGVQVFFLYPMLMKNNEPYISEVDFLTCLDPLLRYKTPVKLGMKTIMIDAGHGGSDPGAMNGQHKEKVYTLQIAKRLQTQLEKLGFRAPGTRRAVQEVQAGPLHLHPLQFLHEQDPRRDRDLPRGPRRRHRNEGLQGQDRKAVRERIRRQQLASRLRDPEGHARGDQRHGPRHAPSGDLRDRERDLPGGPGRSRLPLQRRRTEEDLLAGLPEQDRLRHPRRTRRIRVLPPLRRVRSFTGSVRSRTEQNHTKSTGVPHEGISENVYALRRDDRGGVPRARGGVCAGHGHRYRHGPAGRRNPR